MGAVNKITNTLKVFSLLQPPPETVANFDELILLSEGKIIYCGPVDEVIQYFGSLGYEIPERMDLADWLQVNRSKRTYCDFAFEMETLHVISRFLFSRHFQLVKDGSSSRMLPTIRWENQSW